MNNEINYVSPFKQFVITIGNLPTAYLESMSYYEAITYLVNYLSNNVIPALNNNGLVVEELQAKFTELKNYVDNYFENLDVQEEINNKLDDMVESGELEQIIASYLQTQKIYNTHADLVSDSENLIDGLTVQTLGYHTINDGGGAFYKITSVESATEYQEQYGSLYATLILKDYVTPEMFGAYGDKSHDDTTAFTNACLYSKNIKGNGIYKVDTITLNNIKIECNLATRENTGFTFHDNVYFSGNIENTVSTTVGEEGRCIYITGKNNIIEKSNITGSQRGGAGIVIEETAYNNKILNCNFDASFAQDIIVAGANTIIENCQFDEHTDETLFPIDDGHNNGNAIKVTQYLDFEEENGYNLIIKDNVMYPHGDNPLDCYTGANNVLIDGNYIYSPTKCGIEIKSHTIYDSNINYRIVNNTITGDSCIYVGFHTVTKTNLNNFIISNNYFKTTHGACLNLENVYELLISDNHFVGSGEGTSGLNIVKGDATENPRFTITNCTFTNMYNAIAQASNNYSLFATNLLCDDVTRFTRINDGVVFYISNSRIKTTSDSFGSIAGKLFISSSYLENTTSFLINNSSALVSVMNCLLKSSERVFYRTTSSVLPTLGMAYCDYSQSTTLANFTYEQDTGFTTLTE